MGGKLLNSPTEYKTDSQVLDEYCPFYLAIGMSYAEYWEGDPSLARYYRKAYKIKQDEVNHNAWLHGLYIYDAVSTAIYNALKGKNKKAEKYAEKPYEFQREKTEAEKAKEVEVEQRKALAWMENFVRINSKKSQSH